MVQLSDLTVIVPTRNEALNIGSFLTSLPSQLSLIVVDASEDKTPDHVVAIRPERTKVIRHFSRIAQARQIGAEAANTSWLLFTDADIVFPGDYFNQLCRYQGYEALYGPKLSCDHFKGYYRWMKQGQGLSHKLGIPAVSGSNLLVKRQVFFKVGGFDSRLTCNEDSELGWRIKDQGYQIAFVPNLAVHAHDHRRLQRGILSKLLHSTTRCLLLYFGLIPNRWRGSDWGYWSHLPGSDCS